MEARRRRDEPRDGAGWRAPRGEPFRAPLTWHIMGRMHGLMESVPNFSEGRDGATLDAIRRAIGEHARVLDVHADADHNRSVFTCVGSTAGLVDGLAAAAAVA